MVVITHFLEIRSGWGDNLRVMSPGNANLRLAFPGAYQLVLSVLIQELRMRRWSRIRPGLRWRRPCTCSIIAHRESHQQRQPEKPSDQSNSHQSTAVAHVHEEKNHQQHLAKSDGQRDNRVKRPKIDEGHTRGQQRQSNEAGKNCHIGFRWLNLV